MSILEIILAISMITGLILYLVLGIIIKKRKAKKGKIDDEEED